MRVAWGGSGWWVFGTVFWDCFVCVGGEAAGRGFSHAGGYHTASCTTHDTHDALCSLEAEAASITSGLANKVLMRQSGHYFLNYCAFPQKTPDDVSSTIYSSYQYVVYA